MATTRSVDNNLWLIGRWIESRNNAWLINGKLSRLLNQRLDNLGDVSSQPL